MKPEGDSPKKALARLKRAVLTWLGSRLGVRARVRLRAAAWARAWGLGLPRLGLGAWGWYRFEVRA